MKFCSVNEIEKFSYRDCLITEASLLGDKLVLTLDALIVKPENSQNTNYTESYADTSVMTICSYSVSRVIKEGYKYFDANDVLIEEKPDEDISGGIGDISVLLSEKYLFTCKYTDEKMNSILLEIETVTEDISEVSDTYEILLDAEKVTIEWDRYLNRVQN